MINQNLGEQKLSDSAQQIQDFLKKKGKKIEVKELSESTATSAQAAQTIGCEVAQIVKSIIFRNKKTDEPILVLASGVNQINTKKVETEIESKISIASADYIKDRTGYIPGGIPPVGYKEPIVTLIDEDLLKFDELWAAAGSTHAVFKLRSDEIQSLTGGKIISLKK